MQQPPLNVHADLSRRARGLNFGLSLHLHPFFAYITSKGFGKFRLTCAFVAQQRDKAKKNLVCFG